jgi:hypothetical protein
MPGKDPASGRHVAEEGEKVATRCDLFGLQVLLLPHLTEKGRYTFVSVSPKTPGNDVRGRRRATGMFRLGPLGNFMWEKS